MEHILFHNMSLQYNVFFFPITSSLTFTGIYVIELVLHMSY